MGYLGFTHATHVILYYMLRVTVLIIIVISVTSFSAIDRVNDLLFVCESVSQKVSGVSREDFPTHLNRPVT